MQIEAITEVSEGTDEIAVNSFDLSPEDYVDHLTNQMRQ